MSPPLGLELAGLLGRVEAATGADRELDEALYEWSGAKPPSMTVGGGPYWKSPDGGPQHPSILVPRLTASLDASLALAERVLTGDGPHAVDLLEAAIREMCVRGWMPNQALAPQLARAVIVELLQALIASPASPESGPIQTLEDPNILPLQGVDRDHSPASANLECDGGSAATEGLSQAEGEG